jgi:uncharacterized protein YecT (DUF1311 family)
MEDSSTLAFGECSFRERQAAEAKVKVDKGFTDCQKLLAPEIERQRNSMREVEKLMASTYQDLHRKLEAKAGVYAAIRPKALLEDQRAWSKYRNSHCTIEVQRKSGGGWRLPYRFSLCVEDEAKKRLIYLREFLESIGG